MLRFRLVDVVARVCRIGLPLLIVMHDRGLQQLVWSCIRMYMYVETSVITYQPHTDTYMYVHSIYMYSIMYLQNVLVQFETPSDNP